MGFAAQAVEGGATPQDVTIQFHLTGDGGGDWHADDRQRHDAGAQGQRRRQLHGYARVDDWRDAVLGRNGATLA